MPKNKIEDLRNLLFETMERLMDENDPMDIDRANAVGKVGQVIVNSAKVEADFQKQVGGLGSDFIQTHRKDQKTLPDDYFDTQKALKS